VHPGGVSGTEFNQQASREGGIQLRPWPVGRITRERLADEMVRLAIHPRRSFYISRLYDIPALVNRLFPGLVDWVFAWRVRRQRRGEFRAAGPVRPARYPSPFPFWQIAGGLAVLALAAGLWWAASA
jgi:hypothetical protein